MQDAIIVLWVALAMTGAVSGRVAAAGETAAPGATVQPAPADRPEIIKSIEFEGNYKFKAHVLRERLGFQLGDRLDPFLAEGGRVTIMEVYRKIGYYSVQVTLDRKLLAEGRLLYVIKEGPRIQVQSVKFAGNHAFSTWTLKQVIKLKPRQWLLWPTYFTEESVKEDADRLRDFYYGQGFLNHKITPKTAFSEDRSRVTVVFQIEEGSAYHVANIVFTGQTRYTAAQLRAKIRLQEGAVYKKPQAERDAKELVQLYQEQGYVDVDIRQSATFLPEAQADLVAVTFTIQEGRQFRIGRVEVTGNETTKDKAIRHILDEYGFTPGQVYNAKIAPREGGGLLEKYIQRGIASDQVMIRPVAPTLGSEMEPTRPPPEPTVPDATAPGQLKPDAAEPNRPIVGASNVRDARVNLKEGMTGMIRPGVGFSSDSGFIGQLIYAQRDFDISDVPESWEEVLLPWKAWRGGGQQFYINLQPGTRYSLYSVNFIDPYWNDQPITLDVLGRSWTWYRESYDEGRLKAAVEFEQRLQDYWRRSIGFRAENVKISDLDFDAPQEIRDVQGNNQLFGVKFGLGKSAVDDIYDPTTGWRANLSYEQVTGDFTFGVLEGRLERYVSLYEDVLGRKTYLKGEVLAGTTVGDAPPFDKFYGGGTGRYGLRGFEYRGISPRGLQTNVPNPQYKDPIGSDWIFLAKSELIVPLIGQNFNGLFFVDSGTVESGSYRLAVGFGIEIKVPQIFGDIPMRFQLGFPILKSEGDETQVFSFTGGGLLQ
jgi:outer membrane protein insertion porin family